MDNEWLTTAIRLAKSGKKQEAQEILYGLVKRDPADYQAWLWLADTVSSREERIGILREAMAHNPNNGVIRQALSRLGADSTPPAPPVKPEPAKAEPVKPAEFSISMDDLQSLDQRIHHVEDNAPEMDWLRALSESNASAEEAPPAKKAADDLQPKKASQDVYRPEQEIKRPVEEDHAADFLNIIHQRDVKTPSEPVRLQEVKSEDARKPEIDEVQEGTLLVDGLEYQIEDTAPRRRWLGIIFVVILLAVLAAAVYLGWPTIWGTISPMIAAVSQPVVVEPTATPTITLTPTLTPAPTSTATPRPTNTIEPTVLPTDTSVPSLSNTGLISPENIQQFQICGQGRCPRCGFA